MMFIKSVAKRFVPVAVLLALCFWPSVGQAQLCSATIVGGSTFATIQAAINAAGTGATIQVSGICNENITIVERKERITLDGQATSTINGSAATGSTVIVRARGVTIKRFTVTGGLNGILINRGGTATIDSNIVQATGTNGIAVSLSGFAIIINNTIQNNLGGEGVVVTESSSARIGFVSVNDTVASPNVIQNNGGRGIVAVRSSDARIVGNTISGNADDGIGVFRDAQASASNNILNSNGGNGIFVSQNSGVNLGNDTGTTIFDLPNSTTSNNAGFGIRCALNSYANGRLGNLNGASGPTSFSGSCVNSLIP